MEEINNRIDEITYENGFLKFYKNGALYQQFNLTDYITVESTSEVEIKKAYRTLVNKIRSYGL